MSFLEQASANLAPVEIDSLFFENIPQGTTILKLFPLPLMNEYGQYLSFLNITTFPFKNKMKDGSEKVFYRYAKKDDPVLGIHDGYMEKIKHLPTEEKKVEKEKVKELFAPRFRIICLAYNYTSKKLSLVEMPYTLRKDIYGENGVATKNRNVLNPHSESGWIAITKTGERFETKYHIEIAHVQKQIKTESGEIVEAKVELKEKIPDSILNQPLEFFPNPEKKLERLYWSLEMIQEHIKSKFRLTRNGILEKLGIKEEDSKPVVEELKQEVVAPTVPVAEVVQPVISQPVVAPTIPVAEVVVQPVVQPVTPQSEVVVVTSTIQPVAPPVEQKTEAPKFTSVSADDFLNDLT